MIGGDVVVAWVDKTTLKGYADDYFLDSKSQCAGSRGSCPDERLRVTCSHLTFSCYKRDNNICEISSSHGGEYEVQICLLGCTAV
jgi:hypothetical protein